MAKDNVIGLAMGLDTSSLKAGLADASRRIKTASAEFNAATAGMDDWKSSSEGLQAKLKQLNTTLDVQREALSRMEQHYKETYEGQDENSVAAQNFRNQILKQQAAIGKTEKDLRNYTKSLEDVESAEGETETAVDDANDALNDQKKAAENAGDGFTTLKGVMADLISSGIQSLIGGLVDGAKSLLGTAEASREYRTELAKLDTAAENSGYSTDYAKQKYEDLNSILADSTASNTAVSNFMSIGLAEKDLDTLLDASVGIWTRYGDSIPLDGLAESVNETSKVGAVTGNLADALNWAGINEDKFNESLEACSTEQERQQLIIETLNGEYGESAEAYKENNKELIAANEATQKQADAEARLGEAMQPVATAFTNFKTELMAVIAENVNFEEVTTTVQDILRVFIDEIVPKIIEGFTWLKDNIPIITSLISGIGTAFALLKIIPIISGIIGAVKAWTVATQGMTIAQRLMNLAMAANPVGLVVTIIGALVAALVYLWQTNDGFREAVQKIWGHIVDYFKMAWENIKIVWDVVKDYFQLVWDNIKLIFSVVKKVLSGDFQGAWDAIKKIFSNFEKFFKDTWDKAKNIFKNVDKFFSDKFGDAWTKIKEKFSSVGTFFSGIWDTIKSKFTDIGSKIGDSISSTFKKAVNSTLETAEKVLNKPIGAINSLRKIINKVPGINIGEIAKFTLPRMATGGVVNSATLGLVGEDGQEAVIPLEKNLGWMKKLSANIVKEIQLSDVSRSIGTTNTNNMNYVQNIYTPKQPSVDELYRKTHNLLNLKKAVTN